MHVIVLGAGIVGVATAWALLEDGHRVTVVDRAPEPARGTSFANAGLIVPSQPFAWASPSAPLRLLRAMRQADPPMRLRLGADPAQWAWCLRFLAQCTRRRYRRNTERKHRLAAYSQAELARLCREGGLAVEPLGRGVLYLYEDEAELAAAASVAASFPGLAERTERLDAEGCRTVEPMLERSRRAFAGGIWAPGDESGDARLFTLALADRCRAAGAAFLFDTRVEAIVAEGDRVTGVRTVRGMLAADAYVLALGHDSPALAPGLELAIWPVKGYSATFPIEEHHSAPAVSGIDEAHYIAWGRYGDRFRVTAQADIAGFDASHRPEQFAGKIRVIRDLFPDAADWSRPSYWAGLRPVTPTGLPYLGRARHTNLWLNAGHGSMGWTMAAGSARIVADLMSGRTPAIPLDGLTLDR